VFDLKRRIRIPLFPQGSGTFTANCDTRAISSRRFGGWDDKIVNDYPKSSRVWPIIDHESRERLGNIHGDITPLFNSGDNIHVMVSQSLKKTFPM
jgi:hypothetical protein